MHPLLSLRRPSFLRWPEQSALGQQTLVSGHLEFCLKTTALKPHARDTWEQNCSYPGSVYMLCCYNTSYTPIQVQSTNETSKLWFAVHVWLEEDIRKLWEVML